MVSAAAYLVHSSCGGDTGPSTFDSVRIRLGQTLLPNVPLLLADSLFLTGSCHLSFVLQ